MEVKGVEEREEVKEVVGGKAGVVNVESKLERESVVDEESKIEKESDVNDELEVGKESVMNDVPEAEEKLVVNGESYEIKDNVESGSSENEEVDEKG